MTHVHVTTHAEHRARERYGVSLREHADELDKQLKRPRIHGFHRKGEPDVRAMVYVAGQVMLLGYDRLSRSVVTALPLHNVADSIPA